MTGRRLMYVQWLDARTRQSAQHPDDRAINRRPRGTKWSRGEHYRRKNTGVAYRTFLGIFRPHRDFQGLAF